MSRLLDLFCGAGGAAMGYHRAGFDEIIGVDINPQPNYPFEFVQTDALEYPLEGFDLIHASPPCQHYSIGTRTGKYGHPERYPDLIARCRYLFVNSCYVIENVEGARKWMSNDSIRLCGEMFGLGVVRHRLFESNFGIDQPLHRHHLFPIRHRKKNGAEVQRSAYCQVAGGGGDSRSYKLRDWQDAMGIHWTTRNELKQAIPPAYTEYVGKQFLA